MDALREKETQTANKELIEDEHILMAIYKPRW